MKKERVLVHAVILAVAGFVSRALGLLYGIPLYYIIGEEGNGYYGTAYEIYNMLLLITTYSMPMAISKVMSVYVAEKDYVNCKRLFRTCLFYVLIVGGAGALVTYFFADKLVVAPAVLSLKVMAPTIFFSGFLSVLRGYTQAHNTMIPTAISQIVEQIFNAIFSIALALVFMKYSSSYLPGPAYGAMGSALGTLIGVMVALIFLVVNIMLTRKARVKLYEEAPPKPKESYFTLFRVIFIYAFPIMLTSFIYNVSTTIDMKIFWGWAQARNYSQESAARIFGIYSRQYMVLINVPITIASAISSAMMPKLSVEYASHEIEDVKVRVSRAVRGVVLFAVPSVFGLMILAKPIMQLFFTGTSDVASEALVMGSVSVLFFSVATVLNSALQAMGKSFIAMKNVAKALIVHILYVVGLLKVSGSVMGILVTGSVVYSMAMCFYNINSMEKLFDTKLRVISVIGKPLVASLLMSVIAVICYSILTGIGVSLFFAVIITIIVAAAVYFGMVYTRDDYMGKIIF